MAILTLYDPEVIFGSGGTTHDLLCTDDTCPGYRVTGFEVISYHSPVLSCTLYPTQKVHFSFPEFLNEIFEVTVLPE